jgi:glucose-6-phosphate isomerase
MSDRPTARPAIDTTPEWRALMEHHEMVRDRHLRDLFAEDPERATRFTAEGAGLFLDYSKHRITAETVRLLLDVARAAGVEERRTAMFEGVHINATEDRAVLHTALRLPADERLTVDGQEVSRDVHEVLDRMTAFALRVRSGDWTGATGVRIRNVINIGIGGSDLGPAMATQALVHFADPYMRFRFVSNIDGTDIREATADLDPAATLFIFASKRFTRL